MKASLRGRHFGFGFSSVSEQPRTIAATPIPNFSRISSSASSPPQSSATSCSSAAITSSSSPPFSSTRLATAIGCEM